MDDDDGGGGAGGVPPQSRIETDCHFGLLNSKRTLNLPEKNDYFNIDNRIRAGLGELDFVQFRRAWTRQRLRRAKGDV